MFDLDERVAAKSRFEGESLLSESRGNSVGTYCCSDSSATCLPTSLLLEGCYRATCRHALDATLVGLQCLPH